MRLLVVAALFICGAQGLSFPPECPHREVGMLEVHTGTSLGVNKMATGTPRYGINSPVIDVYEPGETYEFELGRSLEVEDEEVDYYLLLSTAVEERDNVLCPSVGSWHQGRGEPLENCEHILRKHGASGNFTWTAPDCGCLTISAVVVTKGGWLYTDDADRLQGPLTLTLCAEEEDNDPIATPFDDDFYGIEDGDDNLVDELLDEVNNIITEEDDDDDELVEVSEEEIDVDEDGEEHRGRRRGGHRGGRGKGKGRGGHPGGMRRGENEGMRRRGGGGGGRRGGGMRSEEAREFRGVWRKEERSDEEEEEQRRGGRRKMWKKKMGRKMRAGPRAVAKKAEKLERVCEKVDEKANALEMRRPKSIFHQAGFEKLSERWASFREDVMACCDEDVEENEAMVQCFKSAHSRRMSEKMCGAEASDFKDGELPEKIRTAQGRCCELEEEEQRECLIGSIRVARRMKRFHKRHGAVNGTRQVEHICKRVEKQAVPKGKQLSRLSVPQQNRWTSLFTERRLQMSECCNLDESEQPECLSDLREQRLDRVCQGEEELIPPWSRKTNGVDDITNKCCVIESAERYSCFMTEMLERRHGKGRQHHHHHRRPHHHKRRPDGSSEEDADEESVVEVRGGEVEGRRAGRPARKLNRRASKAQRMVRRQKLSCCHGGRKAGNALEVVVNEKWQMCNAEAEGYIVDMQANQDACHKSFRQCCMKTVIRKAREQAVEEAEVEGEVTDI